MFGDEIGWLPWKKPGYELGLVARDVLRENPNAKGVVLESHGLFTWGDDAKSCYTTTIEIINRAIDWLDQRTAGKPAFGGGRHAALEPAERRRIAAALMPAIRGMVSKDTHMVGHFDDRAAVLEFVNARDMGPLAALGTSCPDHFLRTRIRPLVVDFDPASPDLRGYPRRPAGGGRGLPVRRCAAECALPACSTEDRQAVPWRIATSMTSTDLRAPVAKVRKPPCATHRPAGSRTAEGCVKTHRSDLSLEHFPN